MTDQKRFFIAGTDTDIGKTWVAAQFMRELKQAGLTVAGLKPVAAGGIGDDQPYNEDALLLQSLASATPPYHHVNPFFFDRPVAPHIAAEQQSVSLNAADCAKACQPLLSQQADVVVVEGAGGWLVPLNDSETMEDIAKALDCVVVLVVGMRLGCINHALLTVNAIHQSGLVLAGWVANYTDPAMQVAEENQRALLQRIDAPLLASIPFQAQIPGAETRYFDLSKLKLAM